MNGHPCRCCPTRASIRTGHGLCEVHRQRARNYGLTPDEFAELLRSDWACAICGSTAGTPQIDHDHRCCPTTPACGKCVRGVLCQPCNAFVGRVEGSPRLALATDPRTLATVDYLEAHDLFR